MAKGWRFESQRHSMARRGIKTAQKVPRQMLQNPKTLSNKIQQQSVKRDLETVERVRMFLIKEIPKAQNTPVVGTRFLKQDNLLRTVGVLPTADQFRKFSDEYKAGQVTNRVYKRLTVAGVLKPSTLYLELEDDDVTNPKVNTKLRKMDEQILKYLSKEGEPDSLDFNYEFLKDQKGKEQLILYGKEIAQEEPALFKLLRDKVKRG